ncbi:ABC transporter ATP-binding protein [Irregularibacter muris]|uniref:ABC transporter ATP-binding protein n=1 Tax=Irregularibacter muris TaxID=1796619 RepID=A0AAE3HFR4_9FIRM|nr:ABC transporter ATP-binding protein [Irregularibacter muris]MCR1898629.1 ABC transporter ATP-binding protein [Irregularibacter muris]
MDALLTAKKVKKVYSIGETKVHALKGVDLDIYENTFYSIVGKSGSGKSTLLHLLSGMDKPTEGRVVFQGKDMGNLPDKELSRMKRKEFGFVFQAYHLLPELCVLENVLLPVYLDYGEPDQNHVDEVMTCLGLQDKYYKFPSQLSGGEQQRVAIARALMNKPRIIFADEPTGNLDQENSDEVIELLINSSLRFHQSIVLVTHDMDIAQRADRVVHIKDGVLS